MEVKINLPLVLKKAPLIILVLLACSALCFSQKIGIKVSGFIVDKSSHNRLHTVQVYVKEIGPVPVDEEGNFSFEIKRKYVNENISLRIKAPGYEDLSYIHHLSPVEILNQGIEIEMSHNAYWILGQILDSQTRDPISTQGLRVTILGEPELEGIVGNDGSYQLVIPLAVAHKHRNKVSVLVDAQGYRPKVFHLNFDTKEYQHLLGLLWLEKE